jgi:hypothetical protein
MTHVDEGHKDAMGTRYNHIGSKMAIDATQKRVEPSMRPAMSNLRRAMPQLGSKSVGSKPIYATLVHRDCHRE